MLELPQSDDFKSIVLNNTPLIDVRAPIEVQKGAFKNAVNLPLMNNEERHLIGIKYKKHGNAEAVKLGHELVKDDVKDTRVNAWLEGRDHVTPEDVQAILYDVLRHRIALTYEANAKGITTDMVIDELIKVVAVA